MKHTRLHSLLSLMYECPYIDTNIGRALFKFPAKQFSQLGREGLVESFNGFQHNLVVRTGYRLTEEGIDRVNGLRRTVDHLNVSSADEDFPNGLLYTTGFPVLHKGFQRGGNTHFQNLLLTYLWLQLRWHKPQPFSLLWDNVRAKETYPMIGSPDLIFFRNWNIEEKRFERLIMVELELTEKSTPGVFERINTLSENLYSAIIITSPSRQILKNYAVSVRKAIPRSNYFNDRRIFHSKFINGEEYLKKLWFLEWSPTANPVGESQIMDTLLKRVDHPDFDLNGTHLHDEDGRPIYGTIPHDRWEGPREIPLGTLLGALR